VVPLILTLGLFSAQLGTIVAALHRGLWRSLPVWTAYVLIATVHLSTGLILTLGFHQDYPMAIFYLEPLRIIGQIAFTFEASMKYLYRTVGESPERRMLLWLIPLIPAAIVLPIEVGFVQEALANWNSDEVEALSVLYTVRLFLSLTLTAILCIVPIVAKLARKAPSKTATFHHRMLTAYIGCAVLGYVPKVYFGSKYDWPITIMFFLVAPLACFGLWALIMWKRGPEDMDTPEEGVVLEEFPAALENNPIKSI